jgi:hypothetical protein
VFLRDRLEDVFLPTFDRSNEIIRFFVQEEEEEEEEDYD